MKLTQIAIVTALAGSLTIAQAGDKGVGDGTLPEFLQQFDTNEDGKIDTEERQAIKELRDERRKERRDAIDTDGDGKISGEEKKAAHAAIRERIEERVDVLNLLLVSCSLNLKDKLVRVATSC